MKNINEKEKFRVQLIGWEACPEAIEWAHEKTLAQAWKECKKGEWLIWLYVHLHPDRKRERSLAAGYCAATVRHLMKDKRSRDAVDAAIAYGEGRIDIHALRLAGGAATRAAVDAVYKAFSADEARAAGAATRAAYAAVAATRAADAAYAADAARVARAARAATRAAYAAYAADAARAADAAYAAYAADAALVARAATRAADAATRAADAQMADICRKYLRWDYD